MHSHHDGYAHGPRLYLTGVALCMSIFLVALDGTIVSTAIPTITDEFHALSDVGWYGSAFFLTMAAFQAFWGKAYKYFFLKPVFVCAVALFELGSLVCGVAPNSTSLIVGRAITGVGAAGIASGAMTIAAFSVAADKRPVFMGLLGAFYGIAAAMGPLIGGALTSSIGWRWCFYINLPIGGAATAIILLFFKTPDKAKPTPATIREKILQLNPLSIVLIMGAVICYVLALQWGGQTKPWNDSSVIGTLVGFVAILGVFIASERLMGERALFLPRLFKIRAVAQACPFVFFMTGVYSNVIYFLPIYFQSVRGVSAEQSGVRTLALVIPLALFMIVSGGSIRKFGYYKQNLVIGSCLATIGVGLLYTLEVNTPTGHWIGFQLLIGAGVGLAWQPALVACQASVDPADMGLVTSVVLFFQTLGGAFFISAGESGFANRLVSSLKNLAPDLDTATVISSIGASNLHSSLSGSDLAAVLESYVHGLHTVFAISIASGGVAVLLSLAAEWKKINMEKIMLNQGGGLGEMEERSKEISALETVDKEIGSGAGSPAVSTDKQ